MLVTLGIASQCLIVRVALDIISSPSRNPAIFSHSAGARFGHRIQIQVLAYFDCLA